MTDQVEAIPKARPGPKPKAQVNTTELEARVHNLEQLIIRMAHQSGTSHQILKKAGLEPYSPSANDMSKFKKVANR